MGFPITWWNELSGCVCCCLTQLQQHINIHAQRWYIWSFVFSLFLLMQTALITQHRAWNIPSSITPSVFNTHSKPSMYNLSKTEYVTGFIRSSSFPCFTSPQPWKKKNTPSTPTHQWVSVVVIFQEIKYSSKVCGGRICDERTHNVFKKDPQKEQMNTNYLLTPT